MVIFRNICIGFISVSLLVGLSWGDESASGLPSVGPGLTGGHVVPGSPARSEARNCPCVSTGSGKDCTCRADTGCSCRDCACSRCDGDFAKPRMEKAGLPSIGSGLIGGHVVLGSPSRSEARNCPCVSTGSGKDCTCRADTGCSCRDCACSRCDGDFAEPKEKAGFRAAAKPLNSCCQPNSRAASCAAHPTATAVK